ncbi:hypothetical protein OAR20_00220 [Candidatus Pelagibacter sp.]|nr:hypothetical protein [Candidatus Pelagibacter sp.]
MATYKEIKGTQIEVLASDPSNPVEGQVWYNSTSTALKGQIILSAGAFSTANEMNTARSNLGSSNAGTQSSTIAFGGIAPGGGTPTYEGNQTELYNGTTWTNVNNLNVGRSYLAGAGTGTAALAIGGYVGPPGNVTNVEQWNGTSWTAVAAVGVNSKQSTAAAGTTSAAIAYGGFDYGIPGPSDKTEAWNGSGWTAVNDLNTARYYLSGNGTRTAALAAGGETTTTVAVAETWNGTNWANITSMNEARNAGSAFGVYDSFINAGGNPGFSTNAELWNGSNWTEQSNLNSGRATSAASGSSTAGLYFGGQQPAKVGLTEEWSGAGTSITKTFTVS